MSKVGSRATLFRSEVNAAVTATPAHLPGGRTDETGKRTRRGGREEEDFHPLLLLLKLTAAAEETSERLHRAAGDEITGHQGPQYRRVLYRRAAGDSRSLPTCISAASWVFLGGSAGFLR